MLGAPWGLPARQPHPSGPGRRVPRLHSHKMNHKVNHKEPVHHVPKGSSSPSSISQVGFCFSHLLFRCSHSIFCPSHPSPWLQHSPSSWSSPHLGCKSPCHSSPCTISLFLLAPNLTSHFTQQDLSQAKLFLNSCLAIIRITPGDSWARGQTILLTLRFLFLLLFHSHSLSSDVPSSRHESSSKNARGKRHCCGHLFPKHWGRQHVLLVGYS